MLKQVCPVCNSTFYVYPYRLKTDRPLTCSRKCSAQIRPRKSNKAICDYCHKEFQRPASSTNKPHKFCSYKCEKLYFHPNGGYSVTLTCEYCGASFQRKVSQVRQFKHHFCSRKCHNDWLVSQQGQSTHPCWRGGNTGNQWRGPNWKRQSRKARARDKYTCQLCGITEAELGRHLDVHHIKPFFSFISYKQANKLRNLVSLCKVCHSKLEPLEAPKSSRLL